MNARDYDIFICYRREYGAGNAKHLRDILYEKGYRVFFDTDSLRSGSFNHDLIEVIKHCKDFIIILTPGALDRCTNEDDWVRQELACALKSGLNIIPVFTSQFTFPENLPDEIKDIRWKNGIQVSYDYFDAVVAKLISFLKSRPAAVRGNKLILPIIICTAVLTATLVIILMTRNRYVDVSDATDHTPFLTATQKLTSGTTVPSANTTEASETEEPHGVQFIGNFTSHKFHTLDCDVDRQLRNPVLFFSREEAIEQGYTPCPVCNP